MPTIGTAGMRMRGSYQGATVYSVGDVVLYSGASYVAVKTTTGNAPTNTTYWYVLAAAGVSVPASGATDQALAKNSAADYDTLWTSSVSTGTTPQYAPASPMPIPAGAMFDNRQMSDALSTDTFTTGTSYYAPFVIGTTLNIDQLGLYSHASSGVVFLGILGSNPTTGYPGTVIKTLSVNVITGQAYTSTFTAVSVPAGLNYVALYPSTVTGNVYGVDSGTARLLTGKSTPDGAAGPHVFTATGAIASNPTVTVLGGSTPVPAVFMRAA